MHSTKDVLLLISCECLEGELLTRQAHEVWHHQAQPGQHRQSSMLQLRLFRAQDKQTNANMPPCPMNGCNQAPGQKFRVIRLNSHDLPEVRHKLSLLGEAQRVKLIATPSTICPNQTLGELALARR